MIIPIIKYGSPVLRNHSVDVADGENLMQIVKNLSDTLRKEGALGISGPQIGILKRVFLIDSSSLTEADPKNKTNEQVFINQCRLVKKTSKSIDFIDILIKIVL